VKTIKRRELLKILVAHGCLIQSGRGKGSHVVVRCGECVTTVPADREIAPGTLRSIEKVLAPCLGKKWLRG